MEAFWGDAPSTATEELNRAARELEAELRVLLEDVRRGPLHRFRDEGGSYLAELRREFLKDHRRLVVHMRGDRTGTASRAAVHQELAELAARWRILALGRSARVAANEWRPTQVVDTVERAIDLVPASMTASVEAGTFEPREEDSALRATRRALLRFRRWLLRSSEQGTLHRTVELKELATVRFSSMVDRLEGVMSLFVQAKSMLADRTRQALDAVLFGFESIVERPEGADPVDLLGRLRDTVEEEFSSAEAELDRAADEVWKRLAAALGDAMRGFKADLLVAGTLDGPARPRRVARLQRRGAEALADLEERLGAVRNTLSAGYALIGLHLEFITFRERVNLVVDGALEELERDVRGRSHVQIERLLAAVYEAIATLRGDSKATHRGEGNGPHAEARVVQSLEPLGRTLSEVQRAVQQLLSQLTQEQSLASIFDAITRETQSLTDRYEVPVGKIPRAEGKIPPALALVEVPFADVVAAYLQTDVAPEFLNITSAFATTLQPLLDVLGDIERLVTFDLEHTTGDIEFGDTPAREMGASEQVREVLTAGLERERTELVKLLSDSERWAPEIGARLRQVVEERLSQLRSKLAEGEIAQIRARGRVRRREIIRRFGRVTSFFGRAHVRGRRVLRTWIGDERIKAWARLLGLRSADPPMGPAPDRLAAPAQPPGLPVFYRRLFAPQAHWTGDLEVARGEALAHARRVLGGGTEAPLRTAAVVGFDGSGKGAVMGSIARGDGWSSVRRVTFSRPATIEDVERLFSEVQRAQLVTITGLSWLVSARPSGFVPLRALLAGIVEDQGKNAWLLEADRTVWNFAKRGAPLEEVCSAVVPVEPLSASALAGAILARHRLSGLELVFESGHEDRGRRASRNYPQEKFFGRLHAASSGLLQIALSMWIASVVRLDEDDGVLVLGEPPEPLAEPLARLPDDVLLDLYQVARQGWMDAETLAYLFRIDPTASEARLLHLASFGLLKKQQSGTYQLKRHLRGGLNHAFSTREWPT